MKGISLWKILGLMISMTIFSQAGQTAPLEELQKAVSSYGASGSISDKEVESILNDLVQDAMRSFDSQAQKAYRDSFIDMVNAFTGRGISGDAATQLINLARP